MLLNCSAGGESLGQQGYQTSPILKEINPEDLLEGLIAEALILWPPDANSQITGKEPDAGKH